jgi:hypothetical protein
MFGRGILFNDKNFDSILIVAPSHPSKFYRILKKLTADRPDWETFREDRNIIGPQKCLKTFRDNLIVER